MMMPKNPWQAERNKLLLTAFLGCIFYGLFHQAWLAILLATGLYIAHLLFYLFQVQRWIKNAMPLDSKPEAGGVIGKLAYLIYHYKKELEENYRHEQLLTQQLRETLSAIPSATVLLNSDNEIEWANYPALLLLGIDNARDVGIKIDNLLRMPEFLSKIQKVDEENYEQFEISSPVSEHILAMQVVRYGNNRRLLLAHDISAHLALQQSRKIFIANASHELRTPLTVITGYLDYMQSDPSFPKALEEPMQKAQNQAQQMEMLISDLLTLSRLEDKSLKPKHIKAIDLNAHLTAILESLNSSQRTHQHHIQASAPEGLVIYASEKELNSVCYNLINNAINYSEAGSTIEIRWQAHGKKSTKFSVRDEGIGIAPEHISHLTERFYRVDSGRSRKVGGTGLGLSIVKHIVERHHGSLEIHSRLGEGATFAAIFPIHPLDKSSQ